MSLYFETLPNELNYTIISYLDYEEIDNFLFINSQLHYKDLFRFIFPIEYKDIINILKIDKGVRKYRNKWDILYQGYLLKNNLPNGYIPEYLSHMEFKYPQYEDSYICNSIFINIFYTVKLYQEYPEWVWIRNKLFKKFTSDSLSLHIVGSLEGLIKHGIILDPNITDITKNGLKKYELSTESLELYTLLLFIYIDEPNFWMTLDEFIDYLFEVAYNNYSNCSAEIILQYREIYYYAIKYRENKNK